MNIAIKYLFSPYIYKPNILLRGFSSETGFWTMTVSPLYSNDLHSHQIPV